MQQVIMEKIKLSKNSFVRIYDNGQLGYITNQLTKHDRAYNETGADFLAQIKRQPRSIEECVESLCKLYCDATKEELAADFTKFIESLERQKFIVTGMSDEELEENDMSFSYSLENPKTMAYDFTQTTDEKEEYDTQTYLLKHDAVTPRITSMQFELTNRCNERCIHCYIPNGIKNKGINMPLDTFKKLIDQFVALGGLQVTLSGGEALLNDDIIEMLRYCREKDLIITLLSNMTLLDDDIIKVLKDVNVSQVQISLYSMKPEIHDAITTIRGSFEKTKSAIERLHDADIPVQISCPAMKTNKTEFIEVAEYAYSLKMKAHCDYNLIAQEDMDTSNLSNRLSLSDTEELLRGIIKYNTNYQDLIETGDKDVVLKDEELTDLPICGVAKNTICVTANGDLFPCAGWQDYVVGNIYKDTLEEVWTNNERIKHLRSITKNSFPKCMVCEAHDYCAPCLVTNYNESNGDMFKLSPHVCATAFLNKRLVEEWRESQKNGN